MSVQAPIRTLVITTYVDESEGGFVPVVEWGDQGEAPIVERLPKLSTAKSARTLLLMVASSIQARVEQQGIPVTVERRPNWAEPGS